MTNLDRMMGMYRVAVEERNALAEQLSESVLHVKAADAENDALRARVAELEAVVLDLQEDILLEHSYPATGEGEGWLFHSCMSDQEHALGVLVKAGVYELWPDKARSWFRKKPAALAAKETPHA